MADDRGAMLIYMSRGLLARYRDCELWRVMQAASESGIVEVDGCAGGRFTFEGTELILSMSRNTWQAMIFLPEEWHKIQHQECREMELYGMVTDYLKATAELADAMGIQRPHVQVARMMSPTPIANELLERSMDYYHERELKVANGHEPKGVEAMLGIGEKPPVEEFELESDKFKRTNPGKFEHRVKQLTQRVLDQRQAVRMAEVELDRLPEEEWKALRQRIGKIAEASYSDWLTAEEKFRKQDPILFKRYKVAAHIRVHDAA